MDGKDDDTASDDSADDTGAPSLCEGGTSLLDAFGDPSGFEQCADGTIHRPEVQPTTADISAARCAGTEDYLSCSSDAECTDRPNGACITGVQVDGPETYCGCVYACASDNDCNAGEFCAPAGIGNPDITWSTCEPASCVTDADCGSGECGLSVWNDGCQYNVELGCRATDDACRLDADCGSDQTCDLTAGAWSCLSMDCAIGRPLVCEGEARTAPLARVEGWTRAIALALPEDPALRARLGARWAQIAAMEHASVASFARFTLELLAQGAPAELVHAAQLAAADEVRHAQLAYGLASALTGEPLGPGPLSLQGLSPSADRRAFVLSLVAEACVGESLGAAEALQAAERCPNPTLQAALRELAGDEARHAGLAWRTLGWALRGASADLKAEARQAAEQALASLLQLPPLDHAPDQGLLGTAATGDARARAAREVLRPLLDRALGEALA